MGDDYRLLTPENVELRYDVAGLGSRLTAATIDYSIIFFGYLALAIGGSLVGSWVRGPLAAALSDDLEQYLAWTLVALVVLLLFFGWWGYFILFELLWNGQTPGKRLFRLRVVQAEGRPEGAVASLVRNLLRAIDVFLMLGVVVMLIDRSSRRLGDFAAGTLVVREPRTVARGAFYSVRIPAVPESKVEAIPNAGRITMAQYTLVRDFFDRRHALSYEREAELAGRLAGELARVLRVDSWSEFGDAPTFLATVARAFEARHKYYEGGGVTGSGVVGQEPGTER